MQSDLCGSDAGQTLFWSAQQQQEKFNFMKSYCKYLTYQMFLPDFRNDNQRYVKYCTHPDNERKTELDNCNFCICPLQRKGEKE